MQTLVRRILLFAVVPLALIATVSQGRPEFPEKWREVYPNSATGDRECQICHVGADGFEPWNAYGFEIRTNYRDLFNSEDIKAAIVEVENNNSDNDPRNLINLEEIQRGLDPGWTPGPSNVWVFENGDAFVGQLPPEFDRPVDTPPENSLCWPISTSDQTTLVCL